jgi:hypothetical protein
MSGAAIPPSVRGFWNAHVDYFGRECQRLGREFSWNAPVLCEKFNLVYPGGSRASF